MKDAIQPCIFRHPSHGSRFTLPRETDLRPRPIGAILNFLFKLTYGVKLHIDTRKFHDIELVRSINCLLDDLINIEIEVLTCTGIFGPSGFRDNGLSKQRGSDEEVEVYGRTDRSDFAGS